jgi:outer membrane protein TolC
MLATSLLGCANFQPKPLVASKTVALLETRTLDSPGLRDFIGKNLGQSPWPPKAWNLTYLTLAAFYYQPDLDVARAKWGFANAHIITAGMRPNPGLGLFAQQNAVEPGGVVPWGLFWNLGIPVETAGKRGYRVMQAKHLSDQARFDLASTTWKVYSRVRSGLINLYAVRNETDLLQRQVSSREKMVRLLQRRFQSGEISLPEVTQARIALQNTLAALSDSQGRESLASIELASSIGISSLSGIMIDFDGMTGIPNPDMLPAEAIRQEALLNRADILSALAEYEATQNALQLEIAKQYPDMNLGTGYEWGQGWVLGLALPLPVLSQNEGPIAEARAQRKKAAAVFTQLEARTIGEIDSALAAYRASIRKMVAADGSLHEQEVNQRFIESRFNAGDADQFALIESNNNLLSAQLTHLSAIIGEIQSLGRLEDAIQRPLFPSAPIPNIQTSNPRREE